MRGRSWNLLPLSMEERKVDVMDAIVVAVVVVIVAVYIVTGWVVW